MKDGYCEDCGCKVFSGHCVNCHEETHIANQYRDLGEGVPRQIGITEAEQAYNFSKTC